jgi:hypothetical protein
MPAAVHQQEPVNVPQSDIQNGKGGATAADGNRTARQQ